MINVLISSCARPELLEQSFQSFNENVSTTHRLRFFLLEDVVDDKERARKGWDWIWQHELWFDENYESKRKLGYEYAFSEIFKLAYSKNENFTPYFFRLEDDVKFVKPIYLDSMIDVMENEDRLCQYILRRQNHKIVGVDGKDDRMQSNFLYNDFFSIATGLYNFHKTKQILRQSVRCHESSVLTPNMKREGLLSAVNGKDNNDIDYIHVGEELGFDKGKYDPAKL